MNCERTEVLLVSRLAHETDRLLHLLDIPLCDLNVIPHAADELCKALFLLSGCLNPSGMDYRALCYFGETVKFISRRKNDLTKRFPELQTIQIKAESAIIDGEFTAIDEDGLPCFDELTT